MQRDYSPVPPEAARFDLDGILSKFESISLDAMENVALMNRLEAKFTFRLDDLPGLLNQILPHYELLAVGGVRFHRYETLYFDTRALELYAQHHNGIYARHKLRYRRYADSGLCFFEVKTKNNKSRTIKRRIQRPCIASEMEGEAQEFLQREVPCLRAEVHPVLWVNFRRLTLVNKDSPERLTIDLDLSYRTKESSLSLPGLVIAEVKRDCSVIRPPFIQAARERRLWEGSMSKYCVGITSLYPNIKRNRFKERLQQITNLAA